MNDSRVIRMTLQAVASPMMVIVTTLELSFMILHNIYSSGITNDHHLQSLPTIITYDCHL
jgi:hypothetical protein